jgi:uncharacterized protein (DUF427 family)
MLLHETGLPPQVCVPLDDIRADLIQPTDHHTYCPFKGTASYWTVTAGGQVAENAIWAYPEPNDEAGWLEGYAGFYWNAMDEWYDEDERIEGHIRDPYHRVDVRRSSRPVRVLLGDTVLARPVRRCSRDRPAEPLLHPGPTSGGSARKRNTPWPTKAPPTRHAGDRICRAVWSYLRPGDCARSAGTGSFCTTT